MKGLAGGKIVHLRCYMMWMTPTVNVAILGLTGLVALPFVRRLSRPMALRVICVVLGSISFLSILCLESRSTFSRIYFIPKVFLAIGLATVLQRLILRWLLSFERLIRHTIFFVVLLVLVLTISIGGRKYYHERKIITNLPDPPESASNILLIVLDTVRAESMSLYGYERGTTPYLRDLAMEGTVFQNAIATSSWTLPTHASFFTGRFQHETHTGWFDPLDGTYRTLSEALNNNGYITGGFVANLVYCGTEFGLARGFAHYEDRVASVGEFVRSSTLIKFAFDQPWIRRLLGYHELLGRKPATRITKDFLKWLDHVPNNRPFFAFLNYFDAHAPYLPPENFAQKFVGMDHSRTYVSRGRQELSLPSYMTTEDLESRRNRYDGAIAYLDYNLKQLFSELEYRNLLDQTLVIIVSDHGEEFWEHNMIGHGGDLHIQLIRVPLILRFPGIVPDDLTIQEPVTLRDIPATIMDILDLKDDGPFPGRSLRRYWDKLSMNKPKGQELILSELRHNPAEPKAPVAKGDMKSLVIGDMHYIRNGDGTEEVYDLREDPVEFQNLIETPRGVEIASQARHIIEQMIP